MKLKKMSRTSRSRSGEIDALRRAALEFRERLRKRALSVDSAWNAAIYECMGLFGPTCGPIHRVEECQKCWIHEKLRGALRLEASVYIPLKERMINSLERMRRTCTLKGPEHAAYLQALSDVSSELDDFMEDFE
jgi:hypothetical protein